MNVLNRRAFVTGIAASAAYLAARPLPAAVAQRRFTMDLVCGAIGVRLDQFAAIQMAGQFGFESVQPSPHALQPLSDTELAELKQQLKEAGLVWGAAGLPVDFRKDDATFHEGLRSLPALAQGLQRAGATRVSTWLSPTHDQLTYLANFRQHAARLREVAKILQDHGHRLGLEYVGPKKSWSAKRYPFIHSMAETKELIAEIGLQNVGLVLDSWHWYTAGETRADLLTLSNRDVVACDLNDAPAGIPLDQQLDSQRELPAASGVIDLKAFLSALVAMGYDGPVRAEPFNQELNAMDDEAALQATATAMRKAFALIDSP